MVRLTFQRLHKQPKTKYYKTISFKSLQRVQLFEYGNKNVIAKEIKKTNK